MISSNQHFARETDQIESQWRLLTNRQHYARSIHRIKNPSERSELLAGIKDYSLILAAGCLEFLNGQAPAKRKEAALEMLHLTPISRRFTDTAISFGLCDASLAHDEGLVTELKSDLEHIFTPETSNNCGARDLCSIAAISDQELKSEAQGNIGSFDALRADLTRWSDIFRSEQKQLPEKINAALAIFLAIEAENDLRGGIRNEEVSSWIDYYDLTSIDSELIQVWLNYCDPLMRLGYKRLLREAATDPSERGQRALNLLTLFPYNDEHSPTTTPDIFRASRGQDIISELQACGAFIKINPETLGNICTRMQRITTHVAQNYFDFEAPFLKQRRRLAELVIDAGEILLYQHPTPHAITAQEKLLIRELALECIENGSSGRGNPTLSKQTLRAALEIPDHAIRLAALSFLKSPSSQRLGEIMSATPSHGEIAFATQLLTSPFRDMALLWLLQHPAQSLPGAKQMLYAIGIHNELPSIACLTLASQQRSADPIFTSYALKLFKQANNPLLQVHLINVLARCQPNDCDEERKRLFARKRSDAHLRRGATEGLALLGENGVQVLHKELIESGASSQLSLERTNRFFALRMKFSRPDSNIYTDPHGRRTPVLTSRQSEIIDALALAGPRGGIVVREFLQGFDECDVTHIFHNFLRSANQKWFGLSPDQAASAFNKFCDSHTDLCQ